MGYRRRVHGQSNQGRHWVHNSDTAVISRFKSKMEFFRFVPPTLVALSTACFVLVAAIPMPQPLPQDAPADVTSWMDRSPDWVWFQWSGRTNCGHSSARRQCAGSPGGRGQFQQTKQRLWCPANGPGTGCSQPQPIQSLQSESGPASTVRKINGNHHHHTLRSQSYIYEIYFSEYLC